MPIKRSRRKNCGGPPAKLAALLPADHGRTEISPSDPEVQLATDARARILQERCPGARARERRTKREPSLTVGLADISVMV